MKRSAKVKIFETCIVSKLMYSLHTAWFNATARRKLDAFQNRCLRRILGIAPSYVSRVPNAEVIRLAGVRKASATLLQRQLELFGRIAVDPRAVTLRDSFMKPGSLNLNDFDIEGRRRGRPRNYWPQMVRSMAVRVAGDEAHLTTLLPPSSGVSHLNEWKRKVRDFVANY